MTDWRDEELARLREEVARTSEGRVVFNAERADLCATIESLREDNARITQDRDRWLTLAATAADKLKVRAAHEKALTADVARMERWLDRNITVEDAMTLALGRIMADAAEAPNAWEREVVVGSPDGTKRTARFSVAWADGESLHALLARAREERDAAQADARGWRSECDGMMEAIMRKEREIADAEAALAALRGAT